MERIPDFQIPSHIFMVKKKKRKFVFLVRGLLCL